MKTELAKGEQREPSFELFVALVFGFAKAGACYPWLLVVSAVPVIAFKARTFVLDFEAILFLLSGACFLSVLVVVFAVLIGAIVAGVWGLFCHTLHISVSPVPYGFFLGGLIGCFAFGFRGYLIASAGSIWFLILGPMLAMVCGQIGGASAAQRHLRMTSIANWQADWALDEQDSDEAAALKPNTIQFSISQILIFTVWVAVMVLLLKGSGADNSRSFICQLAFCGVAQVVMYQIWKAIDAWRRSYQGPPYEFETP